MLKERKPPPRRLTLTESVQCPNPDFWITGNLHSDLDVCQIGPKMLWMHYLVL